MSAAAEEDGEEVILCASCGTAGSDDIKLRRCNACYLVRYCSVKCQKEHRPKHKKACKKRAAELRDELLFKQPESTHLGDCPICCLPIPIDPQKSSMYSCCSKSICNGCGYANMKRENDGRLQPTCPFCRKAVQNTEEEQVEEMMKRIEVNDPVAIYEMGARKYLEKHYTAAVDFFTKAAALGNMDAHHQLSTMYHEGKGVEKDEKRALHHAERAAIGGHPEARHNLGISDGKNGQYDRAAKHFIIAAKLGCDEALEQVKILFKAGYVSKEDFAVALRGHKAAIDATKSPQREEGEAYAEWLIACSGVGGSAPT